MYETFEHTADIGLRIRAADLDTLFAEAAMAMFSVMVGNLDAVRPTEDVRFGLEADEPDALLRRWLAELLYASQVRHMLFSRFDVTVGPTGLTAIVSGEPLDPARHQADVEIKAVTWHALTVQQGPDGWLAEVILDL